MQAAETESEILQHAKTIMLILNVAGAEKYGADGQISMQPWHGLWQPLAPEITKQGQAVQAEFNKALEVVRNKSKTENLEKPTDGVPPQEDKKGPPVVPGTGEVVFPDGSPEGVPVRDIEDRIKEGQYEDAERDLDRILRYDPQNAKARALRSSARLKQGDFEGALADAEAVLAQDPENKEARQIKDYIELTGRVKGTDMKLKGPDFGSKDMGARFDGGGSAGLAGSGGLMGRPGRSPSQAGRGQAEAVDAAGTGWTATGRGGPDAGAYAPASQGTLPMSQGLNPSQVLARSADKKLRLGDLSGAFLEATRAVQADRGNPAAWTLRASVSNKLKKYDAAISDATEALRIEPKNVPALLERGLAQYNLANYPAALEDIGQALRIEPMNALAYLYRGMVFEKLSRYTEALSDYEMAAKLDPTLRQFWEDAKARLLGKKTGAGGAKARPARRVALRAAFAGIAVLLVLAWLWSRRRKPDEGSEPQAQEPP
ncbi:MAG: tetratricopeptide repeat protein [Elusimicrobia bacterium]|nr:tetratricopeptide repeat protein [Elusimicrobiota bacterium]